MTHRHSRTAVAGAATLLATMPLASVFESWSWLLNAILAIVIVMGTATIARVLRGPTGVQVLAMMAALVLLLTWLFPSGAEIAGVIPSGATFDHFRELFAAAGNDIRNSAIPVPDLPGLLLLATAGIGLVAILVDLTAVGLRRPALAGLPMLALYSVPVAVLRGHLPFLYFAAGCVGFVWLLISDSVDRVRRFGRRFSGEGRDIYLWEPSPLSAAGRRLSIVAIAAAIVIPMAVPTMRTPVMFSNFGPVGGGAGGPGPRGADQPVTSVDMNALLSDSLTQSDVFEMVVVQTNDPSPYYLRLGAAEFVDNEGFHTEPPILGRVLDRLTPSIPAGPVVVEGTYQATIDIRGLSLSLAPLYSRLFSVTGLDENWIYDESLEEIWSDSRNINRSTYTIQYTRLSYDPDALRAVPALSANEPFAKQITVPYSPYVADLVEQLTAGKTNQYDEVRALYDYFHPDNGFRYALTTVDGNSGSPIVDFLINKRGFCVQYAAALAWMVRQAGHAARVAFGFTRGVGSGGVYSMTNRNLHAWTEVFFQGVGWVPFDATPASSVVGSVRRPWAPNVLNPDGDPGEGPNPSAGPLTPPSGIPALPEGGGGGATITVTGLRINLWYVTAGAVALLFLVLLVAPGLRRRSLRRRRRAVLGGVIALTPPPPGQEDLITDPEDMSAAQRDAHNAWAELLDLMIDYGVLIDPAETPRATAKRLAATPQLAQTGHPPTAVLARAEERARYAPAPLRPASLDEAVRLAREAFADNATRWQRLSAALFPRSVLLRWRLAWYGLLARTVRRVSRIRDAIFLVEFRERRRSRPRRTRRRR